MKRLASIFLALFFLWTAGSAFALDAVEVLSGYLYDDPNNDRGYEGVPLFISLDFNTGLLGSGAGAGSSSLDFVAEPFFTVVTAPQNDIEAGSNFLLKYVPFPSGRFQPYFKAGAGVVYMAMHTPQQATRYNFTPQAGAGFHLFFRDNVALSFEYRYRHLSNADLKKPNKGIDSDMILAGVSFFFD